MGFSSQWSKDCWCKLGWRASSLPLSLLNIWDEVIMQNECLHQKSPTEPWEASKAARMRMPDVKYLERCCCLSPWHSSMKWPPLCSSENCPTKFLVLAVNIAFSWRGGHAHSVYCCEHDLRPLGQPGLNFTYHHPPTYWCPWGKVTIFFQVQNIQVSWCTRFEVLLFVVWGKKTSA